MDADTGSNGTGARNARATGAEHAMAASATTSTTTCATTSATAVSSTDPAPNEGVERGTRWVGAFAVAAGLIGLALVATATVGANAVARTAATGAAENSLPLRLSEALGHVSADVHGWTTGTPAAHASPADLAATAQWIVVASALLCGALIVAGVLLRRRA